jgi:hypothetical protein
MLKFRIKQTELPSRSFTVNKKKGQRCKRHSMAKNAPAIEIICAGPAMAGGGNFLDNNSSESYKKKIRMLFRPEGNVKENHDGTERSDVDGAWGQFGRMLRLTGGAHEKDNLRNYSNADGRGPDAGGAVGPGSGSAIF